MNPDGIRKGKIMKAAVKVKNLTKSFGKEKVLKGISHTFEAGTVSTKRSRRSVIPGNEIIIIVKMETLTLPVTKKMKETENGSISLHMRFTQSIREYMADVL